MIHQTKEKLAAIKLLGMLKALEEQETMPDVLSLSFSERFAMIVDREEQERANRRYQGNMKKAKLRYPRAAIEDIEYHKDRNLNKSVIAALGTCEWVRRHQNVVLVGPTGIGKDYIACALAQRACLMGFTALYLRVGRLFTDLDRYRADGSYTRFISQLAKTDVVIFSDFAFGTMTDRERRELKEILEDRYDLRSTIVTSQVPTELWLERIGDPTGSDAIMDRIIHNAHRIPISGPSERLRRSRVGKAPPTT